jgi:CheY-like chemotaxis protein
LNILLNIIASTVESDETVQINFKVVNNKICFSMHEHGSNPNLTIVAEKFLQETGKHTFERMQNADSNLLCLLLLERKAVEINAKFSIKVSDRENSEFMIEFERGNVTPKKIARQAPPPVVDTGKDTVILSFPEEQNSPLATMHDANIIIADADHDGNAILKTLLENDGANIEEVDNSQTLVEKLKTKQYHLLIMSYSLIPTANFLTFLKYLMEQQKLPVVITANQLNGTERQGLLLAGVERCMVKPLDFSLLRRVAVKICTKQQLQQIKDSVDVEQPQQSAETTSTPDALL